MVGTDSSDAQQTHEVTGTLAGCDAFTDAEATHSEGFSEEKDVVECHTGIRIRR